MNHSFFVKGLLNWYRINKRDLPWRETSDPYVIWLSEIILQQTRVNQGLPYFYKFISAFPDIQSLAKANERDVLSLWQGLGYYSRARNLHQSAKVLVKENNSMLPLTYKELLKVKGVGKYTAAAIASFAYKEKTPVVDGNVFRVLSRVFGIESDVASSKGINEIYALAEKLIPEKENDTYNQAIMEFGALHCTPSNPQCDTCPMGKICFANKHGLQQMLPVKSKKLKRKIRYFNYICIKYKKSILMKERIDKDIWQNLYEFPLFEEKEIMESKELLKGLSKKYYKIENESKVFKHVLSHQTIFAKFTIIELLSTEYYNKLLKEYGSKGFSQEKLKILPKSVLINKFLEEYIFD